MSENLLLNEGAQRVNAFAVLQAQVNITRSYKFETVVTEMYWNGGIKLKL